MPFDPLFFEPKEIPKGPQSETFKQSVDEEKKKRAPQALPFGVHVFGLASGPDGANRPNEGFSSNHVGMDKGLGGRRIAGASVNAVATPEADLQRAVDRLWSLMIIISMIAGGVGMLGSFTLKAERLAAEAELKFGGFGREMKRLSKDKIKSMTADLERFAARIERELNALLAKIGLLGLPGVAGAGGSSGRGSVRASLEKTRDDLLKIVSGFDRRIKGIQEDKRDGDGRGDGGKGN